MEHSRLALSDDLYSGYNEYPSALSTEDLVRGKIFQDALRSSYGRRPVVSFKTCVALMYSYRMLLYCVVTVV
jgi:hypothetical protein